MTKFGVNMQIQEVKTKIRELEDNILDLIVKFQKETTCSVIGVKLETLPSHTVTGYFQDYIVGLNVEVEVKL